MKLARLFLAAAVIAASLVCVRLGFWQLSRWDEKRAGNQALRAALAAPPRDLAGPLPPPTELGDRPVRLHGRFDPRFHVLIRGQIREGEPGVRVATPFVRDDSVAVMVERGWLAAADAATVEAGAIPADTSADVVGFAREYTRGGVLPPLRALADEGEHRVWSASRLDLDTLRARLPYPIAPFVLHALPGSPAPNSPRRDPPRPLDEGMHLGYAFQWFGIAVLIPLVAWFAARARVARGPGGAGRSA